MESTPNTNITPTPNPDMNQEYTNTADGQIYSIKQVVPGQGTIFVNKNTQQESMVPENQMNAMQQTNQSPGQGPVPGLKPVLRTSHRRNAMIELDEKHPTTEHGDTVELANKVQDHLMDDIDSAIEQVNTEAQGIDGDINHMVEDAGLFNDLAVEKPEDPTKAITGIDIPGGAHTDTLPQNDIENLDEKLNSPEVGDSLHPLSEFPKKFMASTRPMLKVESKHKSWKEIRAAMPKFGPSTFEERQMVHLASSGLPVKLAKDIGFSPDKRDVGDSGHAKVNNIPVTSPPKEKDKVIGITEFPKGEKRDDSVGLDTGKGYNITMKEMDENQVANREKFDNEQRQMITHMTIREFRDLMTGNAPAKKERDAIEKGKGIQQERQPVKPEEHELYDVEKKAILHMVGLVSFADIDLGAVPEKKNPVTPVTLDVKKTAPKSDSYTEPALIPPAKGKEKEAITKLLATQEELTQLKENLKASLKPHMESIQREQTERGPGIKTKEELLQSYIEMAYNQIDATSEKVVYYAKTIWARLQSQEVTKPQITVAQIVDEALKIDEELARQITEIKERLEAAQGGEFTKRRLYEFPVTPSTEKKLAPEASIRLVSSLHENIVAAIAQFVAGLAQIDADIESSLEMLGA